MAGAAARPERELGGVVRPEHRPGRIDPVEVGLMGTDVGHDEEAVVRRKVGGVRMGRLGASVLHDADSLSQPAVFEHPVGSHGAGDIVDHGQHAAVAGEADVTGAPALGRHLVEQTEPAACRIDGIGTDRSGAATHLVGRVEGAPVGVDGQVGGVFRFQRQADGAQPAVGDLEAADVNTLAALLALG